MRRHHHLFPFPCSLRCGRAVGVLFATLLTLSAMAQNSEHNFGVTKRLDLFNSLYRSLDLQYVDSLDAKKNIETAITAMLSELDPYTEFYSETEGAELREMATGKYAGIGSPIVFRRTAKRCAFATPYEGKPAQKAGVRTGDVIIAVDGKDFGDYTGKDIGAYSARVTEALRGEPGSTFELTLRRPGERRTFKVRITRENISLPNITLSKVFPDGVGYVVLNRYTEHAASELRTAILSLMQQGATSLILDLRGNGGGVVSEAVKIVNFFVPKGKEVLTMRGRTANLHQTYLTEGEPIAPTLPLAVLVDYGTASAAEITAGALQDYDRAVIVGVRTYGKGLVQQPIDLPYDASAKITVAKYYIPSGRCIQAYDFKRRNADGDPLHLPDSLTTEFRTTTGRIVRDGGGILPDVVVAGDSLEPFVANLRESDVYFDFLVRYRQAHPTIDEPEQFRLSDADYKDFVDYLKANGYVYKSASLEYVETLRKFIRSEGYEGRTATALKALIDKLQPNLEADLQQWEREVRKGLESDIVYEYYYEAGLRRHNLAEDPDFKAARNLLHDLPRYHRLLSGAPEP